MRYHTTLSFALLTLFACTPLVAYGADVTCPPADTACLLEAFHTANAGDPTTVTLAAGTYVLDRIDNDDSGEGPNATPVLTGQLTVRGQGAGITILQRPATAPDMRLLQVTQDGCLTLERLTLTGGQGAVNQAQRGGVLHNSGTSILHGVELLSNSATIGGALYSVATGSHLEVHASRCANNFAELLGGCLAAVNAWLDQVLCDGNVSDLFDGCGVVVDAQVDAVVCLNNGTDVSGGCLTTSGTVHVRDSFVGGNLSTVAAGGIDQADGDLTLLRTALVQNGAWHFGGGLRAAGRVRLVESVVLRNQVLVGGLGGGILADDGADVRLVRSVLAFNTATQGPDCSGTVTNKQSFIGDRTGCTVEEHGHDE